MTLSGSIDQATARSLSCSSIDEGRSLSEHAFRRMVLIERKRTERSGCPFLLMLIDGGNYRAKDKNGKGLDTMMATLLRTTRETDIIGWYKDRVTVGAIFTGLESEDKKLIVGAILTRVSNALRGNLTPEHCDLVSISFHFFPDDWDGDVPHQSIDSTPHSDLSTHRGVGQEAIAEQIAVIDAPSTQQPALQDIAVWMADSVLSGGNSSGLETGKGAAHAHRLPRQHGAAGND